ncbi:MAG: hypothetical protein IIY02_04830 [Firmicutes bacterium]|nr:hypothetical protein [Bacillota bacterium]
MKRYRKYILLTILIFMPFCTACDAEGSYSQNPSLRGNHDNNIHNLGLSVENEEKTFTVRTENGYDIIYEMDQNGNPVKALSGFAGYIQYLNIINDTCYYLGITYDPNEQRKESIFTIDLNGKNQNCIYDIPEHSAVTYFSAVGDLLILSIEQEDGETAVHAIHPTEMTEAILLKEDQPIRSLQIRDGVFYYISENTLYSANMDGTDKKKIFKSSSRISNLAIIDDVFYLVQSDDFDHIIAVNTDGKIIDDIFKNGKYITHMNKYKTELIFADYNRDSEGDLKEAILYRFDTQTGELTELSRTSSEYTGIEICGDRIFLHHNDEDLTLKTIPLT